MFKNVLFAVDQSREAREAADVVVNLVKKYDSRLILLSVIDPESSAPKEVVDQLLEAAKNLFGEQGIMAETVERDGKAAFTICDVADEMDVNLIVMGSRGLGLTEDGVEHSVTNRVINLAPCPVLIVP